MNHVVACILFHSPAPTQKLAELFLRFSPQICFVRDRALFIEIGKCLHLYSKESFLARAQVLLRRHGAQATIGFGRDITDALTLTLYQKKTIDELPLKALIEFADPFLRDEALRKSVNAMIDSFDDLGIKDIGLFKKVPVRELVVRFGPVGRHCHSRIHGMDFIQWPAWKPEETILEKKEFPYFEFYGELDPILFELKSQLDRIYSRLFARGQKAMSLEVQIRCEKVSTNPHYLRIFPFQFFTPQGSTKGTLKIIKERLMRDFEKYPVLSPIEAIQTKVIKTVPRKDGQKNIFHAEEEKLEELHTLHDQLVEMLGQENVFQAVLTEDRRPERSWKKKHDSPHEAGLSTVDLTNQIPDRPTYLLRYPLKIEVTAGTVCINQVRYRILNWCPDVEKICGAWYESPQENIQNKFDRNYYNVTLEGNLKVFVFQTPTNNYYIHGYYG